MKLNINMVLYKLKNRKYVYLNKAVKTVGNIMIIMLAICATVTIPIIYNQVTENEAMIYSITSLLAIMSFFDYLTKKIL